MNECVPYRVHIIRKFDCLEVFAKVDFQVRASDSCIFAIGDIVGQPMLAYKAVYKAHVAAEVIAGELQGTKSWPPQPSTPESSPALPTPTPKSHGWA